MLKIIFGFLLISTNVHAVIVNDCGEFHLRGKVVPFKEDQFGMKVVIFENTKNQFSFVVNNKDDASKISTFINQEIDFDAKIFKKMNGTNGEISNIKGIKIKQVNILTYEGSFKKISDLKCD